MDVLSHPPAVSAASCDSCGRSPAREITVRRHVGLLILQQFVTTRVTACRPCGRALVRSYTLRTLWMGWWGIISFFFNWFVLFANAVAWRKLGRLEHPSLSGELVEHAPRGFEPVAEETGRRRLRTVIPVLVVGGLLLIGLGGWAWDATHHDHGGGHAEPAPVAAIEAEMTAAPFVGEDGSEIPISAASCSGDGEAATGGYTHFRCRVTFASGATDEVIVHLLEGDELFFKSVQR